MSYDKKVSKMSETKQVKVDNWGIFFLQRLKTFFNRTDYCDLTLQFQDNAQLKVHRLVLNACTEYFEILERTCEMYEDCLIMPDDLQTDVMVPIINFMYTGHLEYKAELFDKLYQTCQIMNMAVLTKLLDAQRVPAKEVNKPQIQTHQQAHSSMKRSFSKAFRPNNQSAQKVYAPNRKSSAIEKNVTKPVKTISTPVPLTNQSSIQSQSVSATRFKKKNHFDKTPTRYDLPEELDTDNVFDNSFTSISYESKPLMVHPHTKIYSAKKPNYGIFTESTSSKKFDELRGVMKGASTSSRDIVECKRITTHNNDSIFENDTSHSFMEDSDAFGPCSSMTHDNSYKDSNQLFDQILENEPKITMETKDSNVSTGNFDHAKIITEVLKKYPHLVKSNKSIKLKILNAPPKTQAVKTASKKHMNANINSMQKKLLINQDSGPDYTYKSDVMDSEEAARLIALGPENTKGPWICLMCGTPGKALHFISYYKFRRHLVEVHNEKQCVNMCEYCGLKSGKRNYLLHHMYTKHGIEPPPAYYFPKCNQCNYIALTEAFLVKHKLSHPDDRDFRCNVCFISFKSLQTLLNHVQMSGHKICADRKKPNLQCIYCQRLFLRETNLYAHLKTVHKKEAEQDRIIDNSDDEYTTPKDRTIITKNKLMKLESTQFESEDSDDTQYQIQRQTDGNIQVFTKKVNKTPTKKILNEVYNVSPNNKTTVTRNLNNTLFTEFDQNEEIYLDQPEDVNNDGIEIVTENEFVLKQHVFNNKDKFDNEEFIVPEVMNLRSSASEPQNANQTVTNEFVETINHDQSKMTIKTTENISQPIQIVVSNSEEYKALMASNPSIIFDESNTSKTLTVLTTHASALGGPTTINLNNTETNDMMIIPNEFPINVSEGNISADNSNIVVLYSHQMDDQNKQYLVNTHFAQPQHIVSESISAQFVQSPGVITQNFETIPTPTSIVTGQILVPQPVETWHGNVQHTIVSQLNNGQQFEMAVDQQTQMIPDVGDVSGTQTVQETDLIHLPEIQIMAEQSVSAETEIESEEVVDNTVTIEPNESEMPVDQEMADINNETVISDETVQQESEETTNIMISNENEHQTEVESTNVETTNEDISDVNESTNDDENEPVQQSDNSKIDCSSDTKLPNYDIESANNEKVVQYEVEVLEEKLSILPSTQMDSSPKEEEANEEIQCEENEKPVAEEGISIETTIEHQSSDTCEVEESIDNIKQEMNNQTKNISLVKPNIENSDSTEDNATSIEDEDNPEVNNGVDAKEKITSLLNDWDENDSHNEEKSVETDQCEIQTGTGVKDEPQKLQDDVASITKVEGKNDNITKLVSDWDEEEEDDL